MTKKISHDDFNALVERTMDEITDIFERAHASLRRQLAEKEAAVFDAVAKGALYRQERDSLQSQLAAERERAEKAERALREATNAKA